MSREVEDEVVGGREEEGGCPSPPPLMDALQHPHQAIHSVLDAQLEALALGKDLFSSNTLYGGSLGRGEEAGSDLHLHSKSGPHSLLGGTGSSIASASSDHSEVSSSDFESDSGIENCNTDNTSPEVNMALLPGGGGSKKGKGVEPYIEVLPHDDLAVVASPSEADQSDSTGDSCDRRIDTFIKCLDDKVQ